MPINNLGLDSSITRRDFIGGSLIGSGAALLAMNAPGFISSASAQTIPAPLSGLDQSWTGPCGIGDYGPANGNTHAVVNAGHAIRNKEFANMLQSAEESTEEFDLVVVGGGFSGLTAAYNYQQERPSDKCLILENHAIFGGHAKQNEFEVDGVHLWAPQASEGHAGPKAEIERLGINVRYWEELGLPSDFEWQSTSGTNKNLNVAKDRFSPMNVAWERADIGYFFNKGMNGKAAWSS